MGVHEVIHQGRAGRQRLPHVLRPEPLRLLPPAEGVAAPGQAGLGLLLGVSGGLELRQPVGQAVGWRHGEGEPGQAAAGVPQLI
jgi:hypothetical protein